VSDPRASDGPDDPRDRRRERERGRRQARRRRRARARLAAVVLGGAALIVFVLTRGPSPPAVPTTVRTEIAVDVASAGRLPAAVQDAAVAANGRGSLLLLGGIDAAGTSTASVVELDAGGRSTIRAQLPDVQHDAQAALLGGQVYVFGGGDVASYPHILRVDPANDSAASAGELPRPQSDVAVATIGSTAYVVGGFDGVAPLDTIVAWRPGGVARYVARLPFAVRYAAVAAVSGRLIIAGGTGADGVSDAIWSYDPADGSVVQVGVLPQPLTHASAVTFGGRVYVIGGRHAVSGAQTAEIVEIDPASAQSAVVGVLPQPLSDAAVALAGGHIVVAGGEGSDGAPQSAILALTPVVREVTVRTVSAAVAARRAFRALTARGFGQALRAHPGSIAPYEAAAERPGLPGYLLIADRGNNRILVVNAEGRIVWRFPTPADVAAGRILHFNDDTFVEPGGRSLIANEEDYGAVVSVGIASHRITLLFGVPGVLGGGPTHLNYPDDAYALAGGGFTVADAYNCRILFVRNHAIVRQYGVSGDCVHDPPARFGAVNGDTPTPDGGVLVSEIPGHWVDSIAADGTLRWSVQAPVSYPSDPQPLPGDRVLLADYSSPGHIVVMNRHGAALWRYGPASGQGELDHPSLALELPNGDIAVNDDYRDRVVVIDPRSGRIVWQYGHTDEGGTAAGYLHVPDGMDFIPAAPGGGIDWAAVVHP
jgi:outer membrane protein assembly factor BamB